jgi:2-polyprenyl-3-methyl-5-hydroxy-6-metoxy-1,4-benzoquinol methylase
MAQITHGIRAILTYPVIYSSLQMLMGARKSRQHFVAESIQPFPGMKILDIGCGPADILAYLPDVDYRGFDISAKYIEHARAKFAGKGRFNCRCLQFSDLAELPPFDIVLALGVLHHLDDNTATILMQIASNALKTGGKLLTIDPCLDPSQSQIARFLVLHDRGQNVRDKIGYETLAKTSFKDLQVEVRHKTLIPYTRCFMECRK